MSQAVAQPVVADKPPRVVTPPLEAGAKLTRIEFERRYEAATSVKKAELIEGSVYVASPASHAYHSAPDTMLITLLGLYSAGLPGVSVGNNGTIRLDLDNEFQPDSYLFLDSRCGGRVKLVEKGYLEGAPELVTEIAASSTSIDLHQEEAGVSTQRRE